MTSLTINKSPAYFGAGVYPPPSFGTITDNRGTYPSSVIPARELFEITFALTHSATNTLYYYETAPPTGITAKVGITVDLEVSQNGFASWSSYPCFYSRDFSYVLRNTDKDWYYPLSTAAWHARISIKIPGSYSYRIRATDRGGSTLSSESTFTVGTGTSKGDIVVSPHDTRYFEYEDGTYFDGVGFGYTNSQNYSWPVRDAPTITSMGSTGIKLIREWATNNRNLHGSNTHPFRPIGGPQTNHDSLVCPPTADTGYISPLETDGLAWCLESTVSPRSGTLPNKQIVYGWLPNNVISDQSKTYSLQIDYLMPYDQVAAGPGNYGFVALWGGSTVNYMAVGTGTPITPFFNTATAGWQTITQSFTTSAGQYFGINSLHLVLQNVASPANSGPYVPANNHVVYIKRISIREDLGGGNYGPEIITRPTPNMHEYVNEMQCRMYDDVLARFRAAGVKVKFTVQPGADFIQGHINDAGSWTNWNSSDPNQSNGEPFWGPLDSSITKNRFIQRSWWRYVIGRWGWSDAIHSWEFMNEGDGRSTTHANAANLFGAFMKQYPLSQHLCTTSFSSDLYYPFWQLAPNLDYADVHRYLHENDNYTLHVQKPGKPADINHPTPPAYFDTALSHTELSVPLYSPNYSFSKPVMRGEVGWGAAGNATTEFAADTNKIWHHKFLWAQLNAGGLIESNYWDNIHIIPFPSITFAQIQRFTNFLAGIPLSNGNYVDAAPVLSDPVNLIAYGQKDLTNNTFHLWIGNKNHTWKNVVDGVTVTPVTGNVTVGGLLVDGNYNVTTVNTYTGATSTSSIASSGGNLVIPVSSLSTDFAVKATYASPATGPLKRQGGGFHLLRRLRVQR